LLFLAGGDRTVESCSEQEILQAASIAALEFVPAAARADAAIRAMTAAVLELMKK